MIRISDFYGKIKVITLAKERTIGVVKLGEEQFRRYQKIQEENKKLKKEIKKLRNILQHANISTKMDPQKKLAKQVEYEQEAISRNEICPKCKKDLKPIHIIPINKTIYLCRGCSYRKSIRHSDQSE